MAKTYIDVVKYMVETRFEVDGIVERPDIIGAVFGQTEGLLGGDLDLRELQKNGKIGRIEIETSNVSGKTSGKLFLPSSLGRVETCILAAAIESVDRVGPFETDFKIDKVADTRSDRRKRIVLRAKELLKTLLTTEIPDSKEISELVETEVKSSIITTFGPENLPAGPEIANSNEIILVEGRADVVNLLRNDIENCIAIGGATGTIPKTIVDLINSKETTLFIDGDRGGDIIANNIRSAADIDYIAKAPSGKEVEELTRKDIIKALRARMPVDQYFARVKQAEAEERHSMHQRPQPNQQPQQSQRYTEPAVASGASGSGMGSGAGASDMADAALSPTMISNRLLNRAPFPQQEQQRSQFSRPEPARSQFPRQGAEMNIKDMREERAAPRGGVEGIQSIGGAQPSPQAPTPPNDANNQQFIAALGELHNTLRGRLYDSKGAMIAEIPVRDLLQSIQDTGNASVIVFDGVITQRLLELASGRGIKSVYANRQGQVFRMPPNISVYTAER
jgi:DNA primase